MKVGDYDKAASEAVAIGLEAAADILRCEVRTEEPGYFNDPDPTSGWWKPGSWRPTFWTWWLG